MDHIYIDEHNIIDRYGMRKLSAADCVRFEEHFVDCPDCQARLEASDVFRQAIKDVAAADASQLHRRTRLAWPSWITSAGGWRLSIAAAAACVVLLAGTTVVLVKQARALRDELTQTKITAETWQRRDAQARAASTLLEEQLRQVDQRRPVEQARELGQQSSTGRAGRPEKLPVLASILMLNRVRSAELSVTEPVNRLVLPRSPQWIVLSPDRDSELDVLSYRATLKDSRGRVVWNDRFAGDAASGALAINLPSTLFRAGDYVLTLEGRSRDGRSVSLAYSFRVQLTP